ncbi:MAG: arginine--tRNA ligase [Eubacteriales bacterium]|nr:arginine--tRNA ligase [Eubacteriales bacterium]
MQAVKNSLAQTLFSLITGKFGKEPPPPEQLAAMLEYPPDNNMGHLAFPCFKLSRELRMAPPAIASALADGFRNEYVSEVSVAGGYLNFRLCKQAFINHVAQEISEKGDRYGSPMNGDGKTVVLDYSSPNVAKPFHIGHLGTTVIGHSLRLLHEFAGYQCVGINHLGDWGTQFGKMIIAFRKWADKPVDECTVDDLVALYVRFHAEAEKDSSLEDEARAEFTKLEHHDPDDIRLWKKFIEISLKEYKVTYKQLGIEFDSYNGESFYSDKMPAVIEKIRQAGLLEIDDGASVVRLDQYGMPPCLILKRDGSSLYPARDIAAALYRKETYHFSKCIYVTSAGQSLHFAQWFKVLSLMGYPWADSELIHVPYGTVSIGGEKLATRTGNVILLRDIFDTAIEKVKGIMAVKSPDLPHRDEVAEAVGVGAVVFHYLLNNRMRDINFNMEEALSFEGNTGPYAQYTYARCCSILEKAATVPDSPSFSDCGEPELALALVLSQFSERVNSALAEYEPSYITRYILELCTAFNRFYHECQILGCDASLRGARLNLVADTRSVLGTALHLICLKTPNKI